MTPKQVDAVATQIAAELAPVLRVLRADMVARIEAVRSEIEPMKQREQRMADKLARIEQALSGQPRKAA